MSDIRSLIKQAYLGWELVDMLGQEANATLYKINRRNTLTTDEATLQVITIPASLGEVETMRESGMTNGEIYAKLDEMTRECVNTIAQQCADSDGNPGAVEYRIAQDSDGYTRHVMVRKDMKTEPLQRDGQHVAVPAVESAEEPAVEPAVEPAAEAEAVAEAAAEPAEQEEAQPEAPAKHAHKAHAVELDVEAKPMSNFQWRLIVVAVVAVFMLLFYLAISNLQVSEPAKQEPVGNAVQESETIQDEADNG